MTEILFNVEPDSDSGYVAQAIGEAIVTPAEDVQQLRDMVRDAVRCHFPDEANRPKLIRLHFVHDEVIAA